MLHFTSGTTFDETNWTSIAGTAGNTITFWAANTDYLANALVIESNRLYRANADFTSGTTFVLTNWTEVSAQTGVVISDWAPSTFISTK